mgnify:FL=1|tara:strand:+ start:305 stop:514 length:210 start_codon:yes stop_codon:yes gene_type:complete
MKNTELKNPLSNVQKIANTLPLQYVLSFFEACAMDEEWANRLTMDDRLFDILHDVKGILSKDKHFLPRL